jgi:DNA-directed RNA polymerase subunit H (RpoH/RPB5)
MSLNPELIPVKKDAEIIRKTILTNIIKIFVERKNINKSFDKNIQYIAKNRDDDSYTITLDEPIKCKSDDNEYKKKFDGSNVMIKIIHQKVQGIAKIPTVKDYLTSYKYNHKIFIFDSISEKAKDMLTNNNHTEVFNEAFLMINILEHIDSPKYELLNEDEIKEILDSYIIKKKDIPKILTSDPIVKYFNLRRGDIIRIIRPSEQSGKNIAYRIVANG